MAGFINGGFETGSISPWITTDSSGTHSETIVSDIKYRGNYSCKQTSSGSGQSFIKQTFTPLGTHVSLWINVTTNTSDSPIAIRLYEPGFAHYVENTILSTTSGWQNIILDGSSLAAGDWMFYVSTNDYGWSKSCTCYVDNIVSYNPLSAPVSSFTCAPTDGHYPVTTTFTDTSTGGPPTSWYWSFGDGTHSASQNPVKTYSNAGTYSATLAATNAYGTSTSSASIITVGDELTPISLIGVMEIQGQIHYLDLIGVTDIIGETHTINLIGITAASHGVASTFRCWLG